MAEIFFDTWLLNANFHSALEFWKKWPDSKERQRQMEILLDAGKRNQEMAVTIKKDILGSAHPEDNFISRTVAEAYGDFEGGNMVFRTSKGLKFRVGEAKGKGYLFLEYRGQRVGYCRPGFITDIKIK